MLVATDRDGRFKGFPRELFTFFEGLEKNNSKTYWAANHAIWEADIQKPIQDLMAELEPEFGPLRTFRPNRDIRFSNDKSPYKTWVGITTSDRAVGGIGSFFRIGASGMRIACGSMVMAPDQIERFRTAIIDDVSGTKFEQIRKRLAEKSLVVGPGHDPILKRTPPHYPKDHPREELLHWKGAIVIKEYERAAWMYGPEAIERIREVWHSATPLKKWIDMYVGQSKQPRRLPK